ncbi:MAG: RNA 2',3'-cyclic phosphodiesterase [Candidatus Omnitrophica bacterium]|nr:RNA 2',3'-cyclic phosphodiesterase [Candidatus Omnitrophota bacterium]
MAQNQIRAFLAVPFGEIFEKEFSRLEKAFAAYSNDIKFTDPRNVHLTLHFFGSIDIERVETITLMLRNLASRFRAFDLALKDIGAFPNVNHPKVLWVGLDGNICELKDLKEACDLELVRIGVPIEGRDFNPHLTLGRVREGSRVHIIIPDFLKNYTYEQKQKVREIVLFQSELTAKGPIHTPLERFEFKSSPRNL